MLKCIDRWKNERELWDVTFGNYSNQLVIVYISKRKQVALLKPHVVIIWLIFFILTKF